MIAPETPMLDALGRPIAPEVRDRMKKRGIASPESAMQQLAELLYQFQASLPERETRQAA